jgi:hypothetical protein
MYGDRATGEEVRPFPPMVMGIRESVPCLGEQGMRRKWTF